MRKILIVNESQVVRTLLRRYLLSELNDVFIFEADSSNAAIRCLYKEEYEAVVCANQMQDFDGPEIQAKAHRTPLNKNTPFIIITSSDKSEVVGDLVKRGVEHYLISPFTPEQLGAKLNSLCNPRQLRAHTRVCIPGTTAAIKLGGTEVTAKVVNISPNGILCDMYWPREVSQLFDKQAIEVVFPAEYGGVALEGVQCKFLRLSALTYNDKLGLASVRAVWQFIDLPKKSKKTLGTIFEQTQREFDALSIN